MDTTPPRRDFTVRYLVESFEPLDTLCAADIDFIKDDELMGDPPHAPLAARVKAVMKSSTATPTAWAAR